MSHKRKSESELPDPKKHRHKKHREHQQRRESTLHSPDFQPNGDIPDLPRIGGEYEKTVFTHQSAVPAQLSATGLGSYDRLEFLGDAYIEIIASRLLWNQFHDLPAGKLSSIRESLVRNETLARFAGIYGLDKRLSRQQNLTTSSQWTKIKGDVFEAYVAAVILSDPLQGFEIAENWLTQLWLPILKEVKTSTTNLNAKEELARKVMAPGIKLSYVDDRPAVLDKKAGIQTHFIGVYLTGWGWENQHLGSGIGLNKVVAGNEAATRALENRPLIDQVIEKRQEWLKNRDAQRVADVQGQS